MSLFGFSTPSPFT